MRRRTVNRRNVNPVHFMYTQTLPSSCQLDRRLEFFQIAATVFALGGGGKVILTKILVASTIRSAETTRADDEL